jgi:antitoxin component YwqK of YwqJK toxin-antitoxin module
MSIFDVMKSIVTCEYQPDFRDKCEKNSEGLKHGLWLEAQVRDLVYGKRYTESLRMWGEGYYLDGVKIGTWNYYFEHNSRLGVIESWEKDINSNFHSQPTATMTFAPSGKLRSAEKWTNLFSGTHTREETIYDESGQVLEHIVSDKFRRSYYKNGTLKGETLFNSPEKDESDCKYFSKNGELVFHCIRKNASDPKGRRVSEIYKVISGSESEWKKTLGGD